MYSALLTVFLITGAGQAAYGPEEQPAAPCATCPAKAQDGGHAQDGIKGALCDWFGSMPQTCYSPRFGCYPGNGRDIQRYPAFHGYYYRAPYNYRHYFDYPWHAEPHDPQPYFSHSGAPAEGGLTPTPDPSVSSPAPNAPAPAAPMPLNEPQAKAQTFGKAKLLGR